MINSPKRKYGVISERNNLQMSLDEILMNVNWDFVTLPCLLDILRNEPIIRGNKVFR